MPETPIVIEIVGEGKADLGGPLKRDRVDGLTPPNSGVVPVFVHKLCGSPASMRVRRKQLAELENGTLFRKAKFAKTQAYYSMRGGKTHGLVFVVDTDGNHPDKLELLKKGRDSGLHELPMAVGVAHPCIESWLLADASAIRKGMKLSADPSVPEHPEHCRPRIKPPIIPNRPWQTAPASPRS